MEEQITPQHPGIGGTMFTITLDKEWFSSDEPYYYDHTDWKVFDMSLLKQE